MTSARPISARRGLAALAAGSAFVCAPGLAFAEPTFTPLLGSWGGSGAYKLQDGTVERIKCDAYYTGTGSQLGLAVRCSGQTNKIEMRSKLSANGTSLSGNWEERTYNAGGDVKGTLSDTKLSLGIEGGVTGSMTITYDRAKQDIAIATEGIPLKSVTMTLSRK
jgi:hypothetical protein